MFRILCSVYGTSGLGILLEFSLDLSIAIIIKLLLEQSTLCMQLGCDIDSNYAESAMVSSGAAVQLPAVHDVVITS